MSINATAIWRVRPSGSNTNGGGYDPGISGAATDYSRQNAAQVSGAHGTATGTTTFTDAVAANFTSAMVGNAIWIASGAGFTVGAYFVTAFIGATQVTLDRSPGTGTVAVWNLGGGWADFWTNTTSSGPLVPGNQVLILGSGTPNPASYTFDYTITSSFTSASGNSTNGAIIYANDPATPGYKAAPDTTGGMPCIASQVGGVPFNNSVYLVLKGLWAVGGTGSNGALIATTGTNVSTTIGCVIDQNNKPFALSDGNGAIGSIGCEVFSSTGGTGGFPAARISTLGGYIIGCNFHDTNGPGIQANGGGTPFLIANNIVAKCAGYGIKIQNNNGNGSFFMNVNNNTVDGNTGNGIEINDQSLSLAGLCLFNNIISNHTGGATFGLTVDAGTAAQNDSVKQFIDYNVFYNNTTDVNAISYGPHDTHGGANPYVNSAIENYQLA